jgi:hypothetical protein
MAHRRHLSQRVPVTAGQWLKIPMEVTVPGIVVTLAGGAAGTLFI